MLFKFSQIKFLSHFLLGMATVSALIASPVAAVKVFANEAEKCEKIESTNTSNVPEWAHQLTVRIEVRRFFPEPKGTEIASGSGTIIAKKEVTENRFQYTVLTVDHNFGSKFVFDASRPRSEVHLITYEETCKVEAENVTRLSNDSRYGLDLAVVTFESDIEYPLATLAPLPATATIQERINQSVDVTGWPNDQVKKGTPELWHNLGIINPHEDYDYVGTEETRRGYVMGYNAETAGGVSGGPVFDEQGRLIGVHGRGLQNPDEVDPSLGNIIGKTVSGAIPINTFTDQLPNAPNRYIPPILNQSGQNDKKNVFDRLPTDLIGSMSITPSLPPSGSDNENDTANRPPSIDTYLEQAAQHWKNALAVLNASAGAGCVAECREEAEKALAQYDRALEMISDDSSRVRARVLVFRGIVHQLLGNSSKKESDWEAASQIIQGGSEPLAYVWLGNTLYRWGNTQKAEELWDEAVNIANSDNNADVYLEIGKFLIQNGRREEGREYWNRLINSLPENSVIRRKIADEYAYFAMVGYNDFDYDEAALEQAQEAVNLNPNAYSYYDLARVQANLGDTAAAEATLQEAAENCQESICGTLIEDKKDVLGVVTQPSPPEPLPSPDPPDGSVGSADLNTPPSEPEPPEIVTGPTYVCNDANQQTMRRTQPLIEWESREFGWRYQPDDRCTYVSNRLESYETQGLLAQVDRITHGVRNGYRVLCIATDETRANARNCIGGQLIVTLGSVYRTSIGEAEDALGELKSALRDPNYDGLPLDNIKGVKGMSQH